ncbi:hypothetical protein D0962_19550 [Leptolyngbyaceae cyanobacterium CCMR0082]|uniref:MFS transporter n=2 Tax=Adonisia TaxID=2950183 RepID=A0A6M0S8Z9_9CYAN|nr:hypothetical protein [Adonisia turfae CCMR0082]
MHGTPLHSKGGSMIQLIGFMVLLYGIQAACSNPGLAFLPLVTYLTDTLGFSATQLASFQLVVVLPWFIKPLWGLLVDGVPLFGHTFKSYLLICYGGIIVSFVMITSWSEPSAISLVALGLMISTGVAFSDVVADKLMVVEGQKQGNANILQASQWAGLGFTAIAMYGLGGWLAEHTPLSTVFLLSTIFPGIGFIAVLSFFPEQPNKTFTLGRSWQQFWQAAKQPNLKVMLGLILLLDISPTPVDYVYQRQILDFSNTLIGNLKAVECLGLGLGAIAFGILTQRFPKLPLLRLVIISGAISLLSLSFMQDVSSAYGVYLVRGFTVTLRTLGLFGLVVQICPQGAEGFTYALMVSVANLATNIGLLCGGQLYDWGISFAMVAIIGSLYILLCGGGISLIAVYSDKLRGF